MSEVTRPLLMVMLTFFSAWKSPYQRQRLWVSMLLSTESVTTASSTEDSTHVFVGLTAARGVGEDHVIVVDLDDLAVPQEHGAVGEPPRLLHQVGDQNDGHIPLQLLQDVLDPHGGHRVDGDRELVQA